MVKTVGFHREISMSKKMTWNEIQAEYPDQFVYLKDVEWDPQNSTTILSAIVEYASKQPESEYQTRTIKGDFFQAYTAPGTTLQLGALMI